MTKTGDLFAIPLPGIGFVTGHVVLSRQDPDTKLRIGTKSRLKERGSLLLDVYGPVTREPNASASEILIRGIWTDDGPLEEPPSSRWNVIGRRDVDPLCVEFPEWVISVQTMPRFERGEISKPLPIDRSEVDEINCCESFITLERLAKICINLVGRGDLLGEEVILFELDGQIDLRYHPRRAEVYRMLGQDPQITYWDWATAEGLDPGRLWR